MYRISIKRTNILRFSKHVVLRMINLIGIALYKQFNISRRPVIAEWFTHNTFLIPVHYSVVEVKTVIIDAL